MTPEQEDALTNFMALTQSDAETATHLLEACNWDLAQAVDLHMSTMAPTAGDEELARQLGQEAGVSTAAHGSVDSDPFFHPEGSSAIPSIPADDTEDGPRAAIPQRVERLVDAGAPLFRVPSRASRPPQSTFLSGAPDRLATLFAPPMDLLQAESFDDAKAIAESQGRWLLLNIQRDDVFHSHQLNRDLWSKQHVRDILKASFALHQVEATTEEGRKVLSFYRLTVDDAPLILVIEPATGQCMRTVVGSPPPEVDRFMELVMDFIENPPTSSGASVLATRAVKPGQGGHSKPAAAAAPQTPEIPPEAMTEEEQLALAMKLSARDAAVVVDDDVEMDVEEVSVVPAGSKPEAGPSGAAVASGADEVVQVEEEVDAEAAMAEAGREMPGEPEEGSEGSMRVALKLPNGKRETRRFRGSDKVEVLYTWCRSLVPEAATGRDFVIRETVPGAPPLDDKGKTLGESGVAGAMLIMGAMKSFRYVEIPAEIHEEVKEHVMTYKDDEAVQCLVQHLQKHFARTKKTSSQQQQWRDELAKKSGKDGAQVTDRVLDTAVDMQLAETVALVVNRPENGYEGINMYVDDQGVIKDLPVNHRASQIAQMCGLLLEVRGDAFVARFIDNDDDFVRLDFPLSDLSSSASWVAEARRFHESKRRRGGDEMAAFERLVGGRSAGPGKSGSSVKIKEESEAEREKALGNAAFKAQDWGKAAEHYTRAIEKDPSMVAAYTNRALARLKGGDVAGALEDCEEALRKEGGNVKAMLRKGACLRTLGRDADAKEAFESVLRAEPHNKDAKKELETLNAVAGGR